MDSNTRATGMCAEEAVCLFLEEQGCTIIDRNYRYSRYGEIDIIAIEKDTLLFVEVRSKSRRQNITALDSITPSKISRLKKTARSYLISRGDQGSLQCRFDLVTVEAGEIQWIKDIVR